MHYINMFILSALGFLPILPMMAAFHYIMLKNDKKNNMKTSAPHIAAVYIFCFALTAIFFVTGVPSIYRFSFDARINLVPFAAIFTNTVEYLLNILLFVPIGFLMPVLWKKYEKMHLIFICGFSFSLSIELIQLFNHRITDIDDLLMNTVGTIIGYFLFMLLKIIFPKISVFAIDRESHWKQEPFFCFCFAWLSTLVFEHFVLSLFLTPRII